MKNKNDILKSVDEAFSNIRKPSIFINHNDYSCDNELTRYNDIFINHDRDSITIKELGNIGNNPICHMNWEGYLYYFPALVRIALESILYKDMFLMNLSNDKIDQFNDLQKNSVEGLLLYMLSESENNENYDEAGQILRKIKRIKQNI